MTNLSRRSPQKVVEPYDAQCLLCTILIGGEIPVWDEATKNTIMVPRTEQQSYEWRGHTLCRKCALVVARHGDELLDRLDIVEKTIRFKVRRFYRRYQTTLFDEMMGNIRYMLGEQVEQSQMEIAT